jgi:hypothetical protein
MFSSKAFSDEPFAKVKKIQTELNGSCDYQITPEHRADTEFMCQLKALKKRCNEIDDCYVYCASNDIGEDIGGGCAHLCNYANQKEWSPPSEIKSCKE